MNYNVIWGNPIFSQPPIESPMFYAGFDEIFYDEFLKQKSKIVKMKKLIKYYK